MLLDGFQHIGEAAEHMRADGLAFERSRCRAQDLPLGDRNGEVIGPERNQPFDVAGLGLGLFLNTGQRLGTV